VMLRSADTRLCPPAQAQSARPRCALPAHLRGPANKLIPLCVYRADRLIETRFAASSRIRGDWVHGSRHCETPRRLMPGALCSQNRVAARRLSR